MNEMAFLRSIQLSGFLSFPPDSAAIPPRAAQRPYRTKWLGKIQSDRSDRVASRHADGVRRSDPRWRWRSGVAMEGSQGVPLPRRSRQSSKERAPIPDLRYRLSFAASGQRTEVIDETIEETEKRSAPMKDVYFYYRFQKGRPVLNVRDTNGYTPRSLKREDLVPEESVLSQRKGSDVYPELTWLGQQFARIQTFREWSFGRYTPIRQPQPSDLQSEPLLPDSRNLGLLLNELEHTGGQRRLQSTARQVSPTLRAVLDPSSGRDRPVLSA